MHDVARSLNHDGEDVWLCGVARLCGMREAVKRNAEGGVSDTRARATDSHQVIINAGGS